MADRKIKEGEIVELKSGSPKMTVKTIDDSKGGSHYPIWCEWFDETTNSFIVRQFYAGELKIAE